MVETQPYMVFEERVDSNENSIQMSGLDLRKIQRHFEKAKSERAKYRMQM